MANYIESSDLSNLGYSSLPAEAILDAICDISSKIVKTFCGQPIEQTTTEEFIDVRQSTKDYNKIFPSYLPIITINSIHSYNTLTDYTEIDSDYYTINNKIGCILINSSYYDLLKVNYTHGYTTIPDDIKQATLLIASDMISDYYKRNKSNSDGIEKLKDNELEIKYMNNYDSSYISSLSKEILKRYKRVR